MSVPKMAMACETVTPEMAAKWLLLNLPHNRSITRARVEKLSEAMRGGKFRLTGEAVIFTDGADGSECLLDGQHRLIACVLAGVAIRVWVCRHAEAEVFRVIGSGKSRTAADRVSMLGVANASSVASMGRSLYFIERRSINTKELVAQEDILEVCERHRSGIERINGVMLSHRDFRSGRLRSACLWVTYVDRDHGAVFTQSLVDGLNLRRTDPVYHLRERVRTDPSLFQNAPERFGLLLTLVFRAFDDFLNNREVRQVKGTYAFVPWPQGAPYLVEDEKVKDKPKGKKR